jgi:hypothetical protein
MAVLRSPAKAILPAARALDKMLFPDAVTHNFRSIRFILSSLFSQKPRLGNIYKKRQTMQPPMKQETKGREASQKRSDQVRCQEHAELY